MARKRLDMLLVERGLAPSREVAQRLIMAGEVLVNGQLQTKSSLALPLDCLLAVKTPPRFVSRGGEKLQAAFEAFGLQVSGLVCIDIGASTGGFTDCLLQHGARRVIAVDVGRGQLHVRLRADPRVAVLEEINARYLSADALPEQPQFGVADVSFISLTRILPPLAALLPPAAQCVTLIKPQFEAGRRDVAKGGVVKRPEVRERVLAEIRRFGEEQVGLQWLGLCESPLRGPAGNVEYLAWWRTSNAGPTDS